MFKNDARKSLRLPFLVAALAVVGAGYVLYTATAELPRQAVAKEQKQAGNELQDGKQPKKDELAVPPPKIIEGSFLVFAPDGKTFAKDGFLGELDLFNTNTTKRLQHFLQPLHHDTIGAVFSPDGKFIIPAWRNSTELATLVEISTEKVRCGFQDLHWSGEPLAFSPNGKLIASMCRIKKDESPFASSIVRFWDSSTGQRFKKPEIPATGNWIAFCNSGKHILVENYDQKEQTSKVISFSIYEFGTGEYVGEVGEPLKWSSSPQRQWHVLPTLCEIAGEFRVFVGPAKRHVMVPRPG